MTDIFLRSGEANPSDIRLKDPTLADAGGAASIVNAGGIVSAEAIGQPTVTAVSGAASIIDAGGIASGEVIGSSTVTASIVAVGIASTEVGGQPSVGVTVSALGVSSAEAIGSPVVSANISSAGIASTESIGSPSVSATISTTGISSGEAIGQPVVSGPTSVDVRVSWFRFDPLAQQISSPCFLLYPNGEHEVLLSTAETDLLRSVGDNLYFRESNSSMWRKITPQVLYSI